MEIKPNYITDSEGNRKSVILSIEDFEKLIERNEFDNDNLALKNALEIDDGIRITKEEAFSIIESERVKNGL